MTEPELRAAEGNAGAPQARELAVRFHGDAREYFRVWAVNLCLTLLSLGVFSAWAKVRKKRYFYAHTTLDGTPFQYLGQPLPILKGRVIAVALFLLYYASSHFFTAILPYVLILGLLLAPWVIVRSAGFNARYSAFRNMTFRFDANYREALNVLYWTGLIPALVVGTVFDWWNNYYLAGIAYTLFGLSFPWWLARLRRFLVGRTAFGGEHGELDARGRQFFGIYFKAGLIMVLVSLATGALAFALLKGLKPSSLTTVLMALPVYAGYVLSYAYVQARGSNLVWNHTRLGPLAFRSTLTGRGLARLYVTNALAIVTSLGLLTPWAVMRTLRYRADHMHVLLDGGLDAFHGSDATAVRAAGAEVGELFDLDLSL